VNAILANGMKVSTLYFASLSINSVYSKLPPFLKSVYSKLPPLFLLICRNMGLRKVRVVITFIL
jgi:hypothetical protein